LSGRGLCDGLITRPEKSYRLWRVVVCDQETSNEEAKARYGAVKNTTKRGLTPRNMFRAHRAHHQEREIVSLPLVLCVGGRVMYRSEVNF